MTKTRLDVSIAINKTTVKTMQGMPVIRLHDWRTVSYYEIDVTTLSELASSSSGVDGG